MSEKQESNQDQMAPYNSKEIEEKWQRLWREHQLFKARAQKDKEKFFVNFPYPYMNGHLHVGHTFSLLRLEFIARYMMMKGKNVLFPFAFHSTGMPIVAAAERIKEREPKQIEMLKSMSVAEKDIPLFEKAEHWPRYFIKEAVKDLKRLGLAVDWSRSFTTTTLNPYYSKFIEWQFKKLKEKGLVSKGEFPVVWCEHCKSTVGDHDRSEGEGVRPQEFTILKFKTVLAERYTKLTEGKEVFLLAATLRPETVFGQTNLWLDPEVEYLLVEAHLDEKKEIWVMSEPAFLKFKLQKKGLKKLGKIKGRELLGRRCVAPMIKKDIPVLPSGFCDPNIGTGIVSSVPSDAPDDWIALQDLKRDKNMCENYGLDCEEIKKIQPVPIISSEGWGPLPAKEICEKMGIQNQYQREKLEMAKKEIYKTGFYTGVMKENCGEYSGMPVEEAKKKIMKKMVEDGEADVFYQLPEPVVCRCLNPATVKIVKDQWFIKYSHEGWKKKTRMALKRLRLYPPIVRRQFEYVLEWLQDWACARKKGLGTPLPWDPEWIIESLSDSTIYMAYYTISHFFPNWKKMKLDPEEEELQEVIEGQVEAERLQDSFFDFVFLGKGEPGEIAKETGIKEEVVKKMRNEFCYWYPFELRGSAKDLIQNHLAFCLFNHTAIFPEEYWPKGFTLNGWIKVEGEKMSKSKGNFYTLREMLERYGADVTRITLAHAGEGVNDPNLELSFAETIDKRLRAWFIYCKENYSNTEVEEGKELSTIDKWFLSRLNRTVKAVSSEMENTNFKSSLKIGFFDLQNDFRWYLRRSGSKPNQFVVNKMIVTQNLLLCPFVPHYVEEIVHLLGIKKKEEDFASLSPFPEAVEEMISEEVEKLEEFFKDFIEDIRNILNVTGIEPKRIVVYTAEPWMYQVANILLKNDFKNLGAALGSIMKEEKFRKMGKTVPNLVKRLFPFLKENSKRIPFGIEEASFYRENKEFLEKEFRCKLEIYMMSDPKRYDPEGKSKATIPFRPGIFVE